mmetsp:Transcript_16282/g.56910  ORF Transcript_16282/g.56910 Transcript_16282/m.56910 type:complete len:211 (-) Transcript_16282:26-658(-)
MEGSPPLAIAVAVARRARRAVASSTPSLPCTVTPPAAARRYGSSIADARTCRNTLLTSRPPTAAATAPHITNNTTHRTATAALVSRNCSTSLVLARGAVNSTTLVMPTNARPTKVKSALLRVNCPAAMTTSATRMTRINTNRPTPMPITRALSASTASMRGSIVAVALAFETPPPPPPPRAAHLRRPAAPATARRRVPASSRARSAGRPA